jgi:hypothetical protein
MKNKLKLSPEQTILRDQLAIAAMSALIPGRFRYIESSLNNTERKQLSEEAYEWADAMLKARAQ